jgi:hypothetical protein
MLPSIRFGRFGCDDVTGVRCFGWVRESGRALHDAHISKSRYGHPVLWLVGDYVRLQ